MLKTPITFCNFFFIWFTSFQRKCNQNKKDNSTQIVNSPFFVKIKRSKLVIFKLPLSKDEIVIIKYKYFNCLNYTQIAIETNYSNHSSIIKKKDKILAKIQHYRRYYI